MQWLLSNILDNFLSHPVGMQFVDKSNTGTYFFEQIATLRLVSTTLLQATDPLEWSCDRQPGISLMARSHVWLRYNLFYAWSRATKLIPGRLSPDYSSGSGAWRSVVGTTCNVASCSTKVSSSIWFIYKLHILSNIIPSRFVCELYNFSDTSYVCDMLNKTTLTFTWQV